MPDFKLISRHVVALAIYLWAHLRILKMKISEHIYRIDGTNANVYVIFSESGVVQIDSGFRGQLQRIRAFYSSLGVRPGFVLITHSHIDHIWELARVVDEYSPEVYAHPLEAQVIEGQRPMYSSSLLLGVFGRLLRPRPVKGIKGIISMNIKGLEAVETPGHTPGSTSFIYVDDGKKYIFAGDAAFEANGRLFVNRRYATDVSVAERSLDKIIHMGPGIVLPGHGNPVVV